MGFDESFIFKFGVVDRFVVGVVFFGEVFVLFEC